MINRSPGPIPRLPEKPSEGDYAAVNRFFSRIAAGVDANNQGQAVEVIGISTLGNTAGVSGLNSGSIVLAAINNITLSQSVDVYKQATVSISGPTLLSVGVSTLGNTLGTTGLVATRFVLAGGANITLSQSVSGQSATMTISGASAFPAGGWAPYLLLMGG